MRNWGENREFTESPHFKNCCEGKKKEDFTRAEDPGGKVRKPLVSGLFSDKLKLHPKFRKPEIAHSPFGGRSSKSVSLPSVSLHGHFSRDCMPFQNPLIKGRNLNVLEHSPRGPREDF